MKKRLYLSKDNKIIAGVCGGIGEYFQIDPVIVRLIWVVLTFTTLFAGVIAYIVAWIIIPETPKIKQIKPKKKKQKKK